jgi:hypothetical protein
MCERVDSCKNIGVPAVCDVLAERDGSVCARALV